jgi:hypothetical protein
MVKSPIVQSSLLWKTPIFVALNHTFLRDRVQGEYELTLIDKCPKLESPNDLRGFYYRFLAHFEIQITFN